MGVGPECRDHINIGLSELCQPHQPLSKSHRPPNGILSMKWKTDTIRIFIMENGHFYFGSLWRPQVEIGELILRHILDILVHCDRRESVPNGDRVLILNPLLTTIQKLILIFIAVNIDITYPGNINTHSHLVRGALHLRQIASLILSSFRETISHP